MERLILCGGGHVSLEVAHIARRLEFELVIIDDRPEFASRDRFPMAGQVVCAPFLEALDALGSRESDYYVILTRGHAHDRDCLEHVLRGKYAYAGMIGSRTKVAAVKAALEAAGIAREILDGVHSPIGLPIGAQTPAEIAVSIAAELVWERARRGSAAAPARRTWKWSSSSWRRGRSTAASSRKRQSSTPTSASKTEKTEGCTWKSS